VLLPRSPHGHVFAVCLSPSLTTATRAGADLNKTARRAASAGVTAFLLGTCPDEVRTALRTFKPNDAVTSTFRLGNAIPNACARMWLCLCARDLTHVKMRALRDPVSYLSCVHCALGQAGWRPKGEQWNGQRNRPLLIKNKMHILP